jgi:hypothetical protein
MSKSTPFQRIFITRKSIIKYYKMKNHLNANYLGIKIF